MVSSAYKPYQDYEMGTARSNTAKASEDFMKKSKTLFYRASVRIHFVGLFDTVNSVGIFYIPLTSKTYLPKFHWHC